VPPYYHSIHSTLHFPSHGVREAKRTGRKVIDVDGSCLYHLPSFPPLGWTRITDVNRNEVTKILPSVYQTTLYAYLAEGVGNVSGKGAFRALTRGYIHWASGRLHKLEANTCNPTLCFIRCQMRPSVKCGFYTVKMILVKDPNNVAVIKQATCECAAG